MLTANQASAVATPEAQRFTSERLHAIAAREVLVEDIERRLTTALALFVDPVERLMVIGSIERVASRARAAALASAEVA